MSSSIFILAQLQNFKKQRTQKNERLKHVIYYTYQTDAPSIFTVAVARAVIGTVGHFTEH